jgi:hypothetical protein
VGKAHPVPIYPLAVSSQTAMRGSFANYLWRKRGLQVGKSGRKKMMAPLEKGWGSSRHQQHQQLQLLLEKSFFWAADTKSSHFRVIVYINFINRKVHTKK